MKAKQNRPKRTHQKAESPPPIIEEPRTAEARDSVFSKMAIVVPWVVALWLLATTVWYLQTVAEAMRTPMNQGSEMELFKVWIILIASLVISHAIFLRRFVTLAWIAILVLAAGKIVISSQSVTSVSLLIWLLTLSYVSANWFIRRLGAKPSDAPLEWTSVCLAVGLTLVAMLGFGLAMIGRLNPRIIWIVLIVATLVQVRSVWSVAVELYRSIRTQLALAGARITDEHGALVVVIGIVALFNLMWAVSPEIQYDALNYHLPTAKTYLAEQTIVLNAQTQPAHLVEMLYTIGVGLQNQIVAKLTTFAISIIAVIAVYVIGRISFSSRVGIWAAALFYCTPLVSWLAVNTYIDEVVGMFLATALVALLRWRITKQNGWLWTCGILTGAAAASKLTAFMGFPIIGLVVLWDLFRIRGLSLISKLKALAGFLLIAFLISAPWFYKVFMATGNPFFPLLNGLFKSPFGSLTNFNSNAHLFSLGPSKWSILYMPFSFTFETAHFGEAIPRGSVGFALALFPLAILLLVKRHMVAGILFAAAALYLLLLGYSMPYARYYIPILPAVAVLGSAAVIHLSSSSRLKYLNLFLLGVVLIAQASLIPLMYWNIPERVPLQLALGTESREAFLSRALPNYAAISYVNTKSPPDKKVLVVGGENLRFYVHSLMHTPYEMSPYLKGSTPQEWASALIQNGFTFLMVNKSSSETSLPLPYLQEDFLANFAELEYTVGVTDIYRLSEKPIGVGPPQNLLPNPSFETLDAGGMPTEWLGFGQPRIVREKSGAHTGSVSVSVNASAGLFSRLPVEPGKVYSLAHWSRSDKAGQFARLQINWVNEGLEIVGVSIDVVPAGPQWGWNKLSAVAPPTAKQAQIYVSVHELGEVSFDDYTFVKGP
ncbi:MAG TPA: glycosyltransferase family 39 protein, partial [Pyrinomonadaceae bacterium]|nr:glycosyltransferase family 39 protein [Pyrinomonadaceae bacterium]